MDLLNYLQETHFVVPDSDLEQIEEKLLALPKERENALIYNEFRISNAGRLKNRRPQILTSGRFNPNIPNLHTWPLMYFGDVVLLSASYETFSHKSVINCHNGTHFFEILEKLPPHFTPDFYWDNQVEKDHYVPKGIEMAPFPTFASVCHSYYHLSIENICPLFDRVLPLSPLQGAQLEKKFPGKILQIPFGLNWASFDLIMTPNYNKTIDVCVSFGPREDPANKERRTKVIELTKAFEKKYAGRFSFVYSYDLPLDEYIELLKKSLIVINIAGAHGPYNYRTIEALCLGSLIFEADWSDGFFHNDFETLFKEGIHGVSFTFDNFEEKLLYCLTHKEKIGHIAQQGLAFVKENFSYHTLFNSVYEEAKKINVKERAPLPQYLGYFYADMLYYYQAKSSFNSMLSFGSLPIHDEKIPWLKAHNMMIYLDLPKETLGHLYALSLEIDRLKSVQSADTFTVLKSYYKEALENVPPECRWLVEWNFYLLAVKHEKNTPEQLHVVEKYLSKEVEPFPDHAIFKFSIDEEENDRFYNLYFDLNLNIIKVIDRPKERANLFRVYALNYLKILAEETDR